MMDKRFFLALLLTALVVVATPFIFPSSRAARQQARTAADSVRRDAGSAGDSATRVATPATSPATPATATPPAAAAGGTAPALRGADSLTGTAPTTLPVAVETTTVQAGGSTYRFTNYGASPVGVRLDSYEDLSTRGTRDTVQLVRPDDRLLRYRFVVGPGDTIALDTIPFTVQRAPGSGDVAETLRFTAATARGTIGITYAFARGDSVYQAAVTGRLEGAPAGSRLLVELPRGLASAEVDTLDDLRHLAYSFKRGNQEVQSLAFTKLDTALARTDTGQIAWLAERNKYFFTAILSAADGPPIRSVRFEGARPVAKGIVLDARAIASIPLEEGAFGFELYAGPQKYERLNALGRDLINVNPYGGWFAGMVQPFATLVMRALLWLKQTTMLGYGWVLVIFGVIVRLLMWPLQQSAMRNSIKMQRLQPQMQEIQSKYARDPEKMREAMMKMYSEHGMSPFTPMMGCLPMLLPTPVLFALYFVFQNTIEFRGVSFLWLPDLTLKDPYYATPIFMAATMLLVSLISMRGTQQTAQMKMMTYMMPTVFLVMFLNFPSGLNLYYAVQNVVGLPQTWLLSRERQRAGVGGPPPTRSKAA